MAVELEPMTDISKTADFEGVAIGRTDIKGILIRCGDRVRVTERKDGYQETHTEDGWGRTIRLDRADQRYVPPRIDQWDGLIFYSVDFCSFHVRFDSRWPRENAVYMFKEIEVCK